MRYEDVPNSVYEVMNGVRNDFFPELRNANLLMIFDTKRKVSKGKVVLASIKSTSELQKYLTLTESESIDGFDYIIMIDKVVWDTADATDRIRLLRHELRHTVVDDSDKPFKLKDHDVNDFYEELELNKDNPRWAQQLVDRVTSIYDE